MTVTPGICMSAQAELYCAIIKFITFENAYFGRTIAASVLNSKQNTV